MKVGAKNKDLKRRVTIMLTQKEYDRLAKCCPNYKIGAFVRECIARVIGRE